MFPEALIEELVRLDPRCLGEGEEAQSVRGELGAAALGVSVHGWVEVACAEVWKCSNTYLPSQTVFAWLVRSSLGSSARRICPTQELRCSEAGVPCRAIGGNDG